MNTQRHNKIRKIFEVIVLIAAAFVIPAVVIEQLNPNTTWGTVANIMNWVIWAIFAIEAAMLITITKERLRWAKEHPLEIIVVVLSVPLMPPGLQSARAIRLIRLSRLVRLARVTKIAREVFTIKGLYWAAFISFIIIVGGGAAFTIVERAQNLSSWDGVYWAMSTVTTLGSNVSPQTSLGRIISIIVLFVGTGFIAMLTAAVAERFMRYVRANPNIPTADAEVIERLDAISLRLDAIERSLNKNHKNSKY